MTTVTFSLIHITLVTLILVYILIRYECSQSTFLILVLILCGQLFFILTDYSFNLQDVQEMYQDEINDKETKHFDEKITDIKDEDKCCKTLNTEKYAKLTNLPDVIKNNVNEGIDDLIEGSKSNDDYATIFPQNKIYHDEKLRMQYKHLDYFLEKLKLFSKDIYNIIVPTYAKEDYDVMTKRDNEAMKGSKPPPPCPGQENEDTNLESISQ